MDDLSAIRSEAFQWLLEVVLPVVVAYALNVLRQWWAHKQQAIKDENLRIAIDFVMKRLDLTAQTVVEELQQTMVKRGEDGKVINRGALQEESVKRLFSRLDPETQKTLKKMYPTNLGHVLLGKIESKVKTRQSEHIRFEKAINDARIKEALCK